MDYGMRFITCFICILFVSIPARAAIKEKNLHEITVMLIKDFSWVQTQISKKINKPNKAPTTATSAEIISKKEILSAYETISGKKLKITHLNNAYHVIIPEFNLVSSIVLTYKDSTIRPPPPLFHWIGTPRLHGYIATAANTYYNQKKWGDAFFHAESKLKEMGFKTYIRHTKSSHHSHATLWKSSAIKNTKGKSPFANSPELVRGMGERAKEQGLNFIAYYKDTGDEVIAKLHPEWLCKTPDGKRAEEKFLFLDLAGPFKYVALKQIIELADRGAKGVYLDFRHFPVWGCFGGETERLFKLETGLDAPRRVNGAHWQWHPNWKSFLEFQSKKVAETFAFWEMELKKRDPSFQFIISTAYLSGLTTAFHGSALAEVADIVKVEFDHGLKKGLRRRIFDKHPKLARPSDQLLMTLAFTLGRDLSREKLFHSWAYGFPNEAHLKGFISSVIAMGGIAAVHVDDQYLRSDFNPKGYSPVYKSATPYAAYAPAIKQGKRISSAIEGKIPSQWAAVLFSEKLRNSYNNDYEKAWKKVLWPMAGAYESFLELGVPVSLVSDTTLLNDISNYKVLFIPAPVSKLDSKTQFAINHFKKQGGKVITNNPEQWKWDNPKTTKQAKERFKAEVTSLSKKAPFRVIFKNSLYDKSAYAFFYN